MMRALILPCLILPCLALNAMALTTVAETHITAPDGTLASGYIQITAAPSFTAADGSRVETNARIAVVNGQFAVSLEPTDTASNPNAMYLATWHLNDAAPRAEYWAVPTRSGALGVAAVEATPTIGTLGTVVWSACAPSGSGSALSWGALTSAAWSTLTSAGWASLTN